jgi:hypothetical protein
MKISSLILTSLLAHSGLTTIVNDYSGLDLSEIGMTEF